MKRVLMVTLCAVLAGSGLTTLSPTYARADHGGKTKPAQTRVRIALAGAAINGITPKGDADFRSEGSELRLEVEAEDVNLPNGTVLTVDVNGAAIGTLTLARGEGELEIESKNGAAVPAIKAGDTVTVTMGAVTILTGTF